MEVWFYGNRNHGCEANTRGEKSRKDLHPRSSVARRESFCPLDKDLSWKSDYRTSRFRTLCQSDCFFRPIMVPSSFSISHNDSWPLVFNWLGTLSPRRFT